MSEVAAELQAVGQPLSVLSRPLPRIHGLLLESIAYTHREQLQFLNLYTTRQGDVEQVSGEFLHVPSGKRYLISIVDLAVSSRTE